MCTYEGGAACEAACSLGWRAVFQGQNAAGTEAIRAHTCEGLQGSQLGTDPHSHTRTDRPAPSSLFLSPGVSGFQRSLHEDCLLCRVPPRAAHASSDTVMPSRQLRGGSCLDHLKPGGWARICCHPPGSKEAAAPGPGHRLRQMDCLSGHPRTGPGGGQAPPVR